MNDRPRRVLLYGATGYSGRLIAAEGRLRRMADGPDFRMILAARDHDNLSQVAKDNGMQCRCFGLDHPDEVLRQLEELEVDVVINAAGPFAWTAERLARAALAARCHYVDINGEVDVYKRLDDLGLAARRQDVALVSGAAATPATSDILLSAALQQTRATRSSAPSGSPRRASWTLSRGSALSAARQLREQVVTVRRGVRRERGAWQPADVLWHQPIGRLERTFDFGGRDRGERRLAIASAANLIDTLVALCTVRRLERTVRTIESYVETGTAGRIGYQVGGVLAMFSAFPAVRGAANASLGLLPAGPDEEERKATRPHRPARDRRPVPPAAGRLAPGDTQRLPVDGAGRGRRRDAIAGRGPDGVE